MPRHSKRPAPARRKVHRLQADSATLFGGAESFDVLAKASERKRLVVPTRVLNTVIAVFLLPLAAIWSLTFFHLFAQETLHHRYWATEEFWFFGLGAILWGIAFFGIPRRLTIYAYVYGHELTHAVWVWWTPRISPSSGLSNAASAALFAYSIAILDSSFLPHGISKRSPQGHGNPLQQQRRHCP